MELWKGVGQLNDLPCWKRQKQISKPLQVVYKTVYFTCSEDSGRLITWHA